MKNINLESMTFKNTEDFLQYTANNTYSIINDKNFADNRYYSPVVLISDLKTRFNIDITREEILNIIQSMGLYSKNTYSFPIEYAYNKGYVITIPNISNNKKFYDLYLTSKGMMVLHDLIIIIKLNNITREYAVQYYINYDESIQIEN